MLLWFPTFCFGSGGLQTFIDAYGFADDKVYIWGGIAFIFVEFVLCAWYVVFILPGYDMWTRDWRGLRKKMNTRVFATAAHKKLHSYKEVEK